MYINTNNNLIFKFEKIQKRLAIVSRNLTRFHQLYAQIPLYCRLMRPNGSAIAKENKQFCFEDVEMDHF